MNLFIYILIAVLTGYFFIVFFVLRLVAPFFGFTSQMSQEEPPQEVKTAIVQLESSATNQQTYLEAVYNLVLDKTLHQWHHTRFQAALRLPRLFVNDLSEIWQTKDFLYCTAINYASFALLVNSKFFKREDIKVKHVFLNFVLHQYLQVKVGEIWVDFDPSGSGIRHKPLGTHTQFFG